MTLQRRLELMGKLGDYIRQNDLEWQQTKLKAYEKNQQSMTKILKIFILFITLLGTNCSDKKAEADTKSNNEINFSRNVDTLKTLIDLEKYSPVNVMWKISSNTGNPNERSIAPIPNNYVLEAFIQFDRKTADQLKDDYKIKSVLYKEIVIKEYWFDWLPKDKLLKDVNTSSQLFDADFFKKSPLLNGHYVFLNVNTILIRLSRNKHY